MGRKVTNIEEATRRCTGCWTQSQDVQSRCRSCHGTTYWSGVTPTKVQLHLFAIITAAKTVWDMDPNGQTDDHQLEHVLGACLMGEFDDAVALALLEDTKS